MMWYALCHKALFIFLLENACLFHNTVPIKYCSECRYPAEFHVSFLQVNREVLVYDRKTEKLFSHDTGKGGTIIRNTGKCDIAWPVWAAESGTEGRTAI